MVCTKLMPIASLPMTNLMVSRPNTNTMIDFTNWVIHWLQALKRLLNTLQCTHPHRPAVPAGIATCPQCHHQWRIQWELATCNQCYRHIRPQHNHIFGQLLKRHQKPNCSHCNGQQVTISTHWSISPYKAPFASMSLLPIRETQKPGNFYQPQGINEVMIY